MPTLDQLIRDVEKLRDHSPAMGSAATLDDVLHVLKVVKRSNLCPTCIVNAPEPYDCLNTGYTDASLQNRVQALEEALRNVLPYVERRVGKHVREYADHAQSLLPPIQRPS